MSLPRHYQIAIIGAGFCGTMVAVQSMRARPALSVALIEQNTAVGSGLAYGTSDPDHLLNVRAGQMGAFADDPAHFWRWLENNPEYRTPGMTADSFVPRLVYGRYLTDILARCRAEHPSLDIVNQRIIAMRRLPDENFELISSDGNTIVAERVVLAIGNFSPDQIDDGMNPYRASTWQKLADDGDVLIVGTGLTSLDLVVTLAKTKPKGVVHLLSHHGLLPREHTDIKPHILKLQPPHPTTALGLCRVLRREIADAPGMPWQSVVDALRPLNQILWQSLNLTEQRRFMRHLRSYWDVHRHRCAPRVMDAYRALESAGRIVLHHGSIVKQISGDNGWQVTWRPRGQSDVKNFTVRHIVRCTGPQSDFRKLNDVLVQNLLKQNLIAADALHMGIATDDYVACDSAGQKSDGLYALGSLLKGKLYESVAVPELRGQAAEVAKRIANEIG